jgi:hypothetical protein
LQGQQIASYIRSLPVPNPGMPWNPPYQPGPNLKNLPVSQWSSGAGLSWVLENDARALPYLLGDFAKIPEESRSTSLRTLAGEISPDLFRPDGNLDARVIPIALQLPAIT